VYSVADRRVYGVARGKSEGSIQGHANVGRINSGQSFPHGVGSSGFETQNVVGLPRHGWLGKKHHGGGGGAVFVIRHLSRDFLVVRQDHAGALFLANQLHRMLAIDPRQQRGAERGQGSRKQIGEKTR